MLISEKKEHYAFPRKFGVSLLVYGVLMVNSIFAEGAVSLDGLNTVLNAAITFFSSGYMKAILTVALGITTVGLISNRGEPGMFKKFVPWAVAAGVLLSLSLLTGVIFTPSVASATYWNYKDIGN